MAKRLTAQERAQRALTALDELLLGSLSKADQNRVHTATRGLRALDDEQARVKRQIEGLLERYDIEKETTFRSRETSEALVDSLRKLIQEWRTQ